jgi:hypothetical protein
MPIFYNTSRTFTIIKGRMGTDMGSMDSCPPFWVPPMVLGMKNTVVAIAYQVRGNGTFLGILPAHGDR